MTVAPHPSGSWRELAARESAGISVTLLWSPTTNRLAVTVAHASNGDSFELLVEPGERPLDVFNHPFAHAAARGLDWRVDAQDREVTVDA